MPRAPTKTCQSIFHRQAALSKGIGRWWLVRPRTVLLNAGIAVYGQGDAEGPARAVKAAERAIEDVNRVLRERT
jgi:hypothetical protein